MLTEKWMKMADENSNQILSLENSLRKLCYCVPVKLDSGLEWSNEGDATHRFRLRLNGVSLLEISLLERLEISKELPRLIQECNNSMEARFGEINK